MWLLYDVVLLYDVIELTKNVPLGWKKIVKLFKESSYSIIESSIEVSPIVMSFIKSEIWRLT